MQKIIYINSGNRDPGGTAESFTITKNVNIFKNIPKKVKLLHAQIPNTWNNITDDNNKFILQEFPGPVNFNITIPVGRYDATTLGVALKTAMDTATGNVYTVTYSSTTLKYTITMATNFRFNFTAADSIALALGFEVGSITATGTSLTSANVVQLVADYQIAIISNLSGGADNGVIPWVQSNPNLGILALVPVNVCYGSIINYMPSGYPSIECSQSEIARLLTNGTSITTTVRLSFTLAFLSGLPIDLEGANWSCELMLEF